MINAKQKDTSTATLSLSYTMYFLHRHTYPPSAKTKKTEEVGDDDVHKGRDDTYKKGRKAKRLRYPRSTTLKAANKPATTKIKKDGGERWKRRNGAPAFFSLFFF